MDVFLFIILIAQIFGSFFIFGLEIDTGLKILLFIFALIELVPIIALLSARSEIRELKKGNDSLSHAFTDLRRIVLSIHDEQKPTTFQKTDENKTVDNVVEIKPKTDDVINQYSWKCECGQLNDEFDEECQHCFKPKNENK